MIMVRMSKEYTGVCLCYIVPLCVFCLFLSVFASLWFCVLFLCLFVPPLTDCGVMMFIHSCTVFYIYIGVTTEQGRTSRFLC